MKRSYIIAIVAMAVATTVALVSCKKDDPKAMSGNNAQPEKTFTVPEVEDMNAYLEDFKQKMQTVTRGEDESLSLEEAAWHLSSVANYDFANANVGYTDLRYDTLRYQVNVTGGQVLLADLDGVYASMASDIDAFYHSLNLEEKHFRFIGASISENGIVSVPIVTSYMVMNRGLWDHVWHFDDICGVWEFCDNFYDPNASHPANGHGMHEIKDALNLIESHRVTAPGNAPRPGRIYYTFTRTLTFYYADHIDPYGSPFYRSSRLFATRGSFGANMIMDDLYYCTDSYAGLGYSPCQQNEAPVNWEIEFRIEDNKQPQVGHHFMTVDYGRCHMVPSTNEY